MNNNSKLHMKQAVCERTRAWFTVCVLCLHPVVTLRKLSIKVTNLHFSWLPRVGLPGMDYNFESLRASAVLEISMPRTEFHDVCISQLRLNLLVTPTASKKLQTNVMLSYIFLLSFMCF